MRDRLGDKIHLQHIIDALETIERYTNGLTLADFTSNSLYSDATTRQLEIIGEASNRLSEPILLGNPTVPWARIIGLRNMLIHEYFGIDTIAIWKIVQNSLPPFKTAIQQILATMD
jgi:uncharacterized protein with HEPN domain